MADPTLEGRVETLTAEEFRFISAYRQLDDINKRFLWSRVRAIQTPPAGIPAQEFKAFMEGFSFSEDELDTMEDTLQSLRRLPEDRDNQ
jgi:hypothetical protein